MIPAEPNHSAVFVTPEGKRSASRTVVAWDHDGHPLVVGERGLARAETVAVEEGLGKFNRVRTYDLPPVVGVIPGGGWMIEVQRADGSLHVEPVVAWTFTSDGAGEAQVDRGDGVALRPTGTFRIFHPSETSIRPEDA